jgi:hypothetical protein
MVHKGGSFDKFAVALDSWAVELDFDFLGSVFAILTGVEYKKVGSGAVDDALAVAARIADVKIFMVGVALDVFTVEGAGVDVADAFVVRYEVNPVAQP